MLPSSRRQGSALGAVLLVCGAASGLAGCGEHTHSGVDPALGTDAANAERPPSGPPQAQAEGGAAIGTDPADAQVITVITDTCTSNDSLEFPAPCTDAGRAPRDAGGDAARAGDTANLDGAAVAEASTTDGATSCDGPECTADAGLADASYGGPCAQLHPSCSHPNFQVQPMGTCSMGQSFGARSITLRFQACESCGLNGYIDQYAIRIMRCDGCEQVYAENRSATFRQSGHSCRDLALNNVSLEGTTAQDETCVDVYASVGSSNDGFLNESVHDIRVCRCLVQRGTCAPCTSSACGAL